MHDLILAAGLIPALLMALAMLLARRAWRSERSMWRAYLCLSAAALAAALVLALAAPAGAANGWLAASKLSLVCAALVQFLMLAIGAFSARYLEGEPGQQRYAGALAGVAAAVHVLLVADHWIVLIGSWMLVGIVLERLLCFYPERPFAMLAARKKQIADRCADVLLISAAALAWHASGSGSLSGLWPHLAAHGMSLPLHAAACCLVLAVILRSALLPVHGWLIQVMEAPTPVSALLHAGVVNLGALVLIRFAPLLEHAIPARSLLALFGLATAVLAGMVMLTRVSIKVRLAWSTVAQMGFMLLECALGLYTLAALHLLGHSLYKAHAFLSASTVVRATRLRALHPGATAAPSGLLRAPVVAVLTVLLMVHAVDAAAWPWWWSVVLGLAWAPILWLPAAAAPRETARATVSGLAMVSALTALALLAHAVPLGVPDAPNDTLGVSALAGMLVLYLMQVLMQVRAHALQGWRRWSYAGFYLDEIYTRFTLRVCGQRWMPHAVPVHLPLAPASAIN